MPNIRMIWWDYGRVLFDHLTDIFVEDLAALSEPRLKPYEVYAKIHASGVVRRYDAGLSSTEEFMREMETLFGFENRGQFIALWHRILQPNRLAWKIVMGLCRNGYPQGVISNTNEMQAGYIERELNCGSVMIFRPRVYSYRERVAKPDPLIWQRALELANSEYRGRQPFLPEEFVFVDDLAENVDGALACGWHAIHHNPGFVNATLAKLAELDVRL
ncbi:MAG: HAD-IA family hydrolase [Candidatus Sungbacteria bacterium]|nr:HAD-IA family hydrolase [Candidatus Sungbacteria bacterium]